MFYAPDIILTETDRDRLRDLIRLLPAPAPALDFLDQEIARARIAPAADVPDNIARLGAYLIAEEGPERRLVAGTLVFAGPNVRSPGTIAVSSFIGAALIGLGEGQTIHLHTDEGEDWPVHLVKVLAAEPDDGRDAADDLGAALLARWARQRPPRSLLQAAGALATMAGSALMAAVRGDRQRLADVALDLLDRLLGLFVALGVSTDDVAASLRNSKAVSEETEV